jgi:hypothetical protein
MADLASVPATAASGHPVAHMVEIVQALGADAEAQGATVSWDAASRTLRVEADILPGLSQFLQLSVAEDGQGGSTVQATVGLTGPLLDLGAVVIEQSQLDEAAQELASAVAGAALAAPAAPAADALGV